MEKAMNTVWKKILAAPLVVLLVCFVIYFFLAYLFHQKYFGHRLYTLTLTGLFLADTSENRKKVRVFRPALHVIGDGWNIYWINDAGKIFDAERMIGPFSRVR